jgi:phosphatidylglycerol---prolipoprotein diacylglyceryl transferase
MFPELLRFRTPGFLQGTFGDYIVIYSYGFMILVGVLLGFLYCLWKGKKLGLNLDKTSELFIWAFVAVFVGGKLFFYLEDIGVYIKEPAKMFKNMGGGFVFYGSFLFAVPTFIWFFRRNKLPVLETFDIVAVAGTLVHGFGKLGCFMAGCCHGTVCSPQYGVVFTHPKSAAEPLGQPLYPVQLYDAFMVLSISILLMWLQQGRKQFQGQLILLYALIYGVGRCITEEFRGDEARGFLFGGLLSHSQFIAIIILAVGGYIYWRLLKQSKQAKK